MSVTVELGAFTGFTLDDPTLGLLDTGVLDGDIAFVDVSDGVFSVSTNRGRNRDLDRTNAGQVSVEFRNEDRRFDPVSASPIANYIVPRRPVRVSAYGTPVFTGLVDDWNLSYELGGASTSSLQGSDAFTLFARETNADVAAVEELSGARINAVLDQTQIDWPQLQRDINNGNATLGSGIISGNTLTYLQQIEQSEGGLIFMTKDGKFGFRERLFQPTATAIRFADDNSGIPFDAIDITYGTELLANRAIVISAAGTATAADPTSEVIFGSSVREVNSLLAAGSLQGLADYIVARYALPEYRIEQIRVNLQVLTQTQIDSILNLELGDESSIIFTPSNVGSPIELRNRIIGISHFVGIDFHLVTLSFEKLPFEFFILDDSIYGRLDTSPGGLGF